MYLFLGIHHTLVWNKVLQHGRGWLLQIILWGLLRGRKHWRTWCVHGLFHPFKVRNLGTMVGIMSVLTVKSAREVHPEIFIVFLPLAFVVIIPMGVLVTLILVSPSRLVLLGVVSTWSRVIIVLVFPFFLALFD
jgi:hypothetical protein